MFIVSQEILATRKNICFDRSYNATSNRIAHIATLLQAKATTWQSVAA
jgi:hypothetical protein